MGSGTPGDIRRTGDGWEECPQSAPTAQIRAWMPEPLRAHAHLEWPPTPISPFSPASSSCPLPTALERGAGPPQAHPDTADWELPLEEEAGRGRDSPGLGLPLHQPAVAPPLGVGAEVVRQLPAQLLHGAQRIALLQTNHRSLSRWSRWGARPLPPPPALRDQHGHPGLAQTCCTGSQWLPGAGGRGCRLICTLVLVSVN